MISSDYFSRNEPGIFAPIYDTLADQRGPLHAPGGSEILPRCGPAIARELYANSDEWVRKAILNVAVPASFPATVPSPNTRQIWEVKPCPVP
jgi:starch phosphorylase